MVVSIAEGAFDLGVGAASAEQLLTNDVCAGDL